MRLYFVFSLVYAAVSLLLVGYLRGAGFASIFDALLNAIDLAWMLFRIVIWLLPALVLLTLVLGWRELGERLSLVFFALAGTALLQIGFGYIKNLIPLIKPFYADTALADLDQWLHFGVDPWRIAHAVPFDVAAAGMEPAYIGIWALLAMTFPVLLAIFDADPRRRARYLILYTGCWLVIGNVFATLFASVGPVFYDDLLDAQRFAGLTEALRDSGVLDSKVGKLQALLWQSYETTGVSVSTGISAFPSVHVAIATLLLVYLAERSRWLAIPGALFLIVILFLSVFTGYHYAVDGYASIVLVLVAAGLLRRSMGGRAGAAAVPGKLHASAL